MYYITEEVSILLTSNKKITEYLKGIHIDFPVCDSD